MLIPMLLAAQMALPVSAPSAPTIVTPPIQEVFHGRAGDTDVPAPRLEAVVEVDGALTEPVWSQAALLTGFSQYEPLDGVAAEDSTEVLIWYAADALYVGIRAFEPHGQVNATLADRDQVFGDDNLQILLDTFDDRRQALVFAVNPLGVQADGVRNEAVSSQSGYFDANEAQRGALDLRPDFVYESRGRVTERGYEVEMRIPFKSIRFQSTETQRWGLNVLRSVQHSGQTLSWTPMRRGATSFLGQSGRLTGLEGLRAGLVLDLAPVVTQQLVGAAGPDGWGYDASGTQLGLDARWGITPNLTANATINPDFSQVEADVAQIQFDPRQAVSFPEKRPFFLEGSENFSVPNGLIYTRSIVDPLGAAKVTGKVGGFTVAALSAVDDDALSWAGPEADRNPVINILRVRRDVGESSSWGAVYTDRFDGDDYNHVAGLDGRFILGGDHTLTVQGAGSLTAVGGSDLTGWLWDGRIEKSGRRWGWNGYLRGYDDDFIAGAGFVSRKGVYSGLVPRVTFFGDPGSVLESWSTALNLNAWWLYDRFTGGEARPDEMKLHFNNSLAVRGGWRLGASLLVENFLYPDYLYADYAIERRDDAGAVTDTVAFTGTPSINNYDVAFTLGTPQFPTFSASAFVLVGRDENFPEWAPGWIVWADLQADWRPTARVRVTPQYNETRVIRPGDGSVVQLIRIPRMKLEYQVSRPFFVRLVGQYVAFRQDALRDDSRTDDPILIRGGDGVYRPALARESNGLQLDWLLSYRPTPGTVLFAGYGSTLGDDRPFGFRELARQADGFFLKASYLFRL